MKKYSSTEIKAILKELGILPFPGHMVSSTQAAKIMTWRAKAELGIEHPYKADHVRRHVSTGTLSPAGELNDHFKLFEAKDIFALRLMPGRGIGAMVRERRKQPTEPRLPAIKEKNHG